MNKKGQEESLKFFVGLIIAIALVSLFILAVYQMFASNATIDSFDVLVEEIKSLKESKVIPYHIGQNFFLVGFKKDDLIMKTRCFYGRGTSPSSRGYERPELCEDDKACICICRLPNLALPTNLCGWIKCESFDEIDLRGGEYCNEIFVPSFVLQETLTSQWRKQTDWVLSLSKVGDIVFMDTQGSPETDVFSRFVEQYKTCKDYKGLNCKCGDTFSALESGIGITLDQVDENVLIKYLIDKQVIYEEVFEDSTLCLWRADGSYNDVPKIALSQSQGFALVKPKLDRICVHNIGRDDVVKTMLECSAADSENVVVIDFTSTDLPVETVMERLSEKIQAKGESFVVLTNPDLESVFEGGNSVRSKILKNIEVDDVSVYINFLQTADYPEDFMEDKVYINFYPGNTEASALASNVKNALNNFFIREKIDVDIIVQAQQYTVDYNNEEAGLLFFDLPNQKADLSKYYNKKGELPAIAIRFYFVDNLNFLFPLEQGKQEDNQQKLADTVLEGVNAYWM